MVPVPVSIAFPSRDADCETAARARSVFFDLLAQEDAHAHLCHLVALSLEQVQWSSSSLMIDSNNSRVARLALPWRPDGRIVAADSVSSAACRSRSSGHVGPMCNGFSLLTTAPFQEHDARDEFLGVLHLAHARFSITCAAVHSPSWSKALMDHVLVDGGELVGEQLVENVDQFLVAFMLVSCGLDAGTCRVLTGFQQQESRTSQSRNPPRHLRGRLGRCRLMTQ